MCRWAGSPRRTKSPRPSRFSPATTHRSSPRRRSWSTAASPPPTSPRCSLRVRHYPADGDRGITLGRISYCGVAPLVVRAAIFAIGIIGGTPPLPPTGAALTPVPGNAPAVWLTALGTAAQACGTDSGPMATALPMPAVTAAPPPRDGAEPSTPAPEANPPARADPADLTVEAAAVVVEPRFLASELNAFVVVMGMLVR